MARDRRRADLAKFLKAYDDFGAPAGEAAEQAIWIILARHGTKEGAGRALKAIWRRFVNVNELRVARATEVSVLIGRHVRNDPIRVADDARGFLRRFHKDHHTVDFRAVDSLTADQLRKYLGNAKEHVQELALALFLHYCQQEIAAEKAATAPDADGKTKKRPEKDVTLAAERLRMLAAAAAAGQVVAKTRQATAARNLVGAWKYAPLPEPAPVPTKPPAAAPATPKPAANKGGGATRPRTTRTARARSTKSSRR